MKASLGGAGGARPVADEKGERKEKRFVPASEYPEGRQPRQHDRGNPDATNAAR